METMKKPRAILIVDVQNLFYSARDIYGRLARINFKRLRERCEEKYDIIEAVAYVAGDNQEQISPFLEALEKAGFNPITSRLRAGDEEVYETDWDVGITVSVIERLEEFDILILASGDGDYSHLLDHLREKEKGTVAVGFKREIERTLEKFADDVMYLTEEDIFYQVEK